MPSKTINLLHLINGFGIGGAEKHLLAALRRFDRGRFRIFVCSVGQGGPLQSEFEATDVPVAVFVKRGRFDLTLVDRVARFIRRERIQVLQTALFYADVIGVAATRLCSGPAVISVEHASHGEHDTLRVSPRHILAYRWALKHVDRVVAVSEEIRDTVVRIRKVPPRKVITIPNGIEILPVPPGLREKTRTELGVELDQPILGIVGRLDEVKGHRVLFDAMTRVRYRFPDVVCLVVGDGPIRNDLEAEIRRLGLDRAVRFLGFRKDMQSLYAAMDALVMPSITEGLPITLLEAMAAGKTVVASRVGGIPEVVTDEETGLLVPSRDAEVLACALIRVLDCPAWAAHLGERARRRVEARHSIRAEVEKYESLYWSLLERKQGLR